MDRWGGKAVKGCRHKQLEGGASPLLEARGVREVSALTGDSDGAAEADNSHQPKKCVCEFEVVKEQSHCCT